MKKIFAGILSATLMAFALYGCSAVGDKSTSMSIIYGATTVLSLLLLISYCCFIKKKEIWFLLLFASVFVVNSGYFTLSVSKTLEEALLANRISYLGSVFLPFSMFMIILNFSRLKYKKVVPIALLVISIGMFFVAASPGYLDIYYKSVTLQQIDGVSVLVKEYGAWHCLYLYYLILYFAFMIGVILHSTFKKKHNSVIQAAILLISVFVNICVWLLEQLVKIDFEFLSVSYIISELFLITLYLMLQDDVNKNLPQDNDEKNTTQYPAAYIERCRYLEEHILELTATEKAIYECYIAGKSTKDIMKELNITENTLKFHNKNLYSKLGVTSRKQILEYVKALKEIKVK